jgi:hypothetical protein
MEMKKCAIFFLGLFFVGAFFLPQAGVSTQVLVKKPLPLPQPNQATLANFTPKAVTLHPGGPAAVVTVDGQYLETVLSAGIIKDGRGVPEITAKLVQPWPGSRKIELQATAAAPVAPGYQLRFIGKAGLKDFRLDVPLSLFSLEVVVKKMELQTSSKLIVNTNTQLQMPLNPDLFVSSVRIDPPDPSTMTGFVVWATIRNQGSRDAFLARGWSIAKAAFSGRDPNLFLGSNQGSNFTLKAGASQEVYVTKFDSYYTHEGDWTVTVRVDPDKQIAETNEGNNDRSTNLTVRYETPPPPIQPADLIITDLWLEPEVATLEGNFELVGIVKNQGGRDATFPAGYKNVLDEIGDHIQQYLSAPLTIHPGEAKEIRCKPRLLQAGTSTWTVIVDRYSHVPESDENNNKKTIEVTIK